MKRVGFTLLAAMLLLAAGCAPVKSGHVTPVPLTEEEAGMVEVVGKAVGGAEVLRFTYEMPQKLQSRDFWMELYEYGQPKGILLQAATYADEPVDMAGSVAVVSTNMLSAPKWTVEIAEEGGGASCFSGNAPHIPAGLTVYGGDVITEPLDVLPEQEYVLAVYTFATQGGSPVFSTEDMQKLLEDTTPLESQQYAVLLKCRFSANQF